MVFYRILAATFFVILIVATFLAVINSHLHLWEADGISWFDWLWIIPVWLINGYEMFSGNKD